MISKRAQSIDSSGIRRVFDLAAKLKNPINLSIGQPEFDAFDELKEGAISAIEKGKNSYTLTQGIPELRAKVLSQYGLSFDDSSRGTDCFISSGVSGGLFLSLLATLDPGDQILVPDPFFCMYRDLAYLINAEPVFYDTYPEFKLPLEEIEQKITPKTKAIILNTPSNPTGIAYSESEIEALIEIARRAGIWLIYDEIYSAFTYDLPHTNVLGRYENTIILNGFSKSHGITGWRVGYVLGPKLVLSEMLKIQQYSFVCAPSIAQHALVEGFETSLTQIVADYKEKRDFIVAALKDKFNFISPTGAFYLFAEAPGGSGTEFVERCIEKGLLVVPGSVFSEKDTHFRISFSASLDDLGRGAEILNSLA